MRGAGIKIMVCSQHCSHCNRGTDAYPNYPPNSILLSHSAITMVDLQADLNSSLDG